MSVIAHDAMRTLQRQQLKRIRKYLGTDPLAPSSDNIDARAVLRELITVTVWLLDETERLDAQLRTMRHMGA